MAPLSCSQDNQSKLQTSTVKISIKVLEGWCPYVSEVDERLFQARGIQAAPSRNPGSSSLFPKQTSHAQAGEKQSSFSLLNAEVGEMYMNHEWKR